MAYFLRALTKQTVKEAIFVGIDTLHKTNDAQVALDAAIQKATKNGAQAEVEGGAFAELAEAIIHMLADYEKQKS